MSLSISRNVLINLILMSTVFDCAHFEMIDTSEEDWLLRELSGAHLLIAASPDPPWFNERLEANGTYTYWGFHIEICNYIARAINSTYSFVRTREDEERELGRKGAIYQLLMRGEVNIATKFVLLVFDECNRVDCSIPLHTSRTSLMVPWPEEESRILAPIRPFQIEVWVLLSISILCAVLTMTYLPKFYHKSNKNTSNENEIRDVGNAALYVLTGEGTWNQWKNRISFRIIQGTWCLAAFVLLNAYSSTIISYLTAPKLMPVTKTLQELGFGHPQNLKVLAEKNGGLEVVCLAATAGPYKVLGDSLRNNPDSLFNTRLEGFNKLLSKKYGYISVTERVMVYMDMAFNHSGINHCSFTVSNEEVTSPSPVVWTFPKHWRYTNAVNNKMKWFAESGLANYWAEKTTPRLDQCQLDNYAVASAKRRVLSLNDLMGPFLFLLAGISVSLLTFLMEIVAFKFRKHA